MFFIGPYVLPLWLRASFHPLSKMPKGHGVPVYRVLLYITIGHEAGHEIPAKCLRLIHFLKVARHACAPFSIFILHYSGRVEHCQHGTHNINNVAYVFNVLPVWASVRLYNGRLSAGVYSPVPVNTGQIKALQAVLRACYIVCGLFPNAY